MAHTESAYDNLGRVYETYVYNPGTAYAIETDLYHEPLGKLVKLIDDDANATEYTYDLAGQLTTVKDATGSNYVYATYDPAGRVVVRETKQGDGLETPRREVVITYYDDLGRVTTVANWGANAPTGWVWGSITEPIEWGDVTIPDEPESSGTDTLVTLIQHGYDDEFGRYTRVTDPMGIQRYAYSDRLGRTVRTVESADAIDRATLYAYDQAVDGSPCYQDLIIAGNEPYADQVTCYERACAANADLVTRTVYPDGGVVSVLYDADGRVTDRVDQRNWKTSFTYDALGRVVQEDVTALGETAVTGTTQVTYEYDALGRLTEVTDNNASGTGDDSEVDYVYSWVDSDCQQVTSTQKIGGVTMGTVTTKVNPVGERTYLQYPNTRELTFAYDALHRLDTITGGGATLADYDYLGYYVNELKLNANALKLTFEDLADYDDWGRIAKIRYKDVSPDEDRVEIAYQYDYASNPTWRYDMENNSSPAWSQKYTYDDLHRLARAEQGVISDWETTPTIAAAKTWNWNDVDENGKMDKLGNWVLYDDNGTEDVRTHNAANEIETRLHEGKHKNVLSDAAGNVIDDGSLTASANGCYYSYDYRNRIVAVQARCDSSAVATYLYDGFNRRIKKDLAGEGTDVVYLYDGWRCIEEQEYISSEWKAKRQYVHGGRYIDEVLLFDKDTNDDGICDDARYIYCQDANFNVVALTDSAGVIVEKTWYEAYGKATWYYDSDEQTASSVGNAYLFQGRRLCTESGLYYFRNRDMSPTLGRFLQRDPIGYADGMSLYEYVRGGPTYALDPSGRRRATDMERDFWVSWFSHALPIKLLNNYLDGTGTPIELTEDEMVATGAIVDVRRSSEFRKMVREIKEAGGGLRSAEFTGWGGAVLSGTLGNFDIHYHGVLCVYPDGSWWFRGTMDWSDKYDFDPRPFDPAISGRPTKAEVKVRVAHYLIPGKPFDITTVKTPVAQTSSDNEAQWAGTGQQGNAAASNKGIGSGADTSAGTEIRTGGNAAAGVDIGAGT